MNKRGMSGVVVTILIVLISIVLIVGLGILINSFIKKGSNQLSASKLIVDTRIESANVNYSSNMASIRVKRNIGPGNIVGLKFVFTDDRNSDVIERRFGNFNELAERTFDFNLTLETPNLVIRKIDKVSVAPILKLESGEEAIGKVSDSFEGLMRNITGRVKETEPDMCISNSDCGIDYFLENSKYCGSDSNAYQYKKVYTCLLGFCYNDVNSILTEDCSGKTCYDGKCVENKIGCTNESVHIDCGIDGIFGQPKCSQDAKSVVQDYKVYECINLTCSSRIITNVIKNCNATEVCFNAECFVPLECTQDSDCPPGKICDNGTCVAETPLNSGTVFSIWPFYIGEYFDSPDLPDPTNTNYVGKYISFTTGVDKRCFKVKEHKKPNVTQAYSYIRLNETVTNVSAGNLYQILRTDFSCGRI